MGFKMKLLCFKAILLAVTVTAIEGTDLFYKDNNGKNKLRIKMIVL